ncbi:TIGR03084 family metal-binding protein [Thermodesulfobacteriota bacterium]
MEEICRDLSGEHKALDTVVSDLDEAAWNKLTPAEGWTIKDQISHLAFFDDKARLAAADQKAFKQHITEMMKQIKTSRRPDTILAEGLSNQELLEFWRRERTSLIEALQSVDPKFRVPWYGPSMSARSHATARLMETWAHGQDIVDALEVNRTPTDRLYHIAHLGFTTFGWSHATHGVEVPETPVRVELTSPSGKLWTWGPEEAENRVRGSAEDFCLVVTQRRNVADTNINAEGEIARQWMSIAQVFAGEGTTGPEAGTFKKQKS